MNENVLVLPFDFGCNVHVWADDKPVAFELLQAEFGGAIVVQACPFACDLQAFTISGIPLHCSEVQ